MFVLLPDIISYFLDFNEDIRRANNKYETPKQRKSEIYLTRLYSSDFAIHVSAISTEVKPTNENLEFGLTHNDN